MDLQKTLEPKYEGFSFGTDVKRTAALLRSMADDLEGGRINLHALKLIQNVKMDDFYGQSLIIRFYEKVSAGPSPQNIDA